LKERKDETQEEGRRGYSEKDGWVEEGIFGRKERGAVGRKREGNKGGRKE
jgi:hypothetical protein